MRIAAFAALLSLWSGCGADDDGGGDVTCLDPAGACFEPARCVEDDDGMPSCSFEHLPAPSCSAAPTDVEERLTVSGGVPTHWMLLDECVPVTYDPTLAGSAEAIGTAVATYGELACNQLCLEPPDALEAPLALERRERRIHFRLPIGDESFPGNGLTTTYYEVDRVRIFAAEVLVAEDAADTLTAREALGLLLFASGVGRGSEPSVLDGDGSGPATLTASDEAALCYLHGDPPACAPLP